jgi:D-alanyl-D-alanine carboxypeptidase
MIVNRDPKPIYHSAPSGNGGAAIPRSFGKITPIARLSVFLSVFLLAAIIAGSAFAAPRSSFVVDARTGEILHSDGADRRLHPASLTKMMTLYIAFQAVEYGEISLDDEITISENAASEPPSKLGLRPGQKIQLRYLIRAAAVGSANDAATAIAEAISGSETGFARRMNRTAESIGMRNTTFRNAHGLTREGHLSTARDMTTLGRQLFFDFPEYYNLFSRLSTDSEVRDMSHTNTRFLNGYRGADGIKTGYTRAAGFNMTASVERGGVRLIATIFGGSSTGDRNARLTKILDEAFEDAPTYVALKPPPLPRYEGEPALIPSYQPGVETVASTDLRTPVPAPEPLAPRNQAATDLFGAGFGDMLEQREAFATALRPASQELIEIRIALEQRNSSGNAKMFEPAAFPPIPRHLLPKRGTPQEISPNAAPGRQLSLRAPPLRQTPYVAPVPTVMEVNGGPQGARSTDYVSWSVTIGQYASPSDAAMAMENAAMISRGSLNVASRAITRTPLGYDARFGDLTNTQAEGICATLKSGSIACGVAVQ